MTDQQTRMAESISKSHSDFRYNKVHSEFAAMMAAVCHEVDPTMDKGEFIRACIPEVFRPTSLANRWHKLADLGLTTLPR